MKYVIFNVYILFYKILSVADGPSTGHDDFFQKELLESNTQDILTVKVLQEKQRAKDIKSKFPDRKDIAEAYEKVQLTAVGSLRELRLSTTHNLEDFRESLTGSDDTLSDGEVTEDEFLVLQESVDDLERLDVDTDMLGYASLPENMIHLANVPFSEYSSSQAEMMLEHYQKALPTYRDTGLSNVDGSNSFNDIGGKPGLRVAQQILIDTAYGANTYSNGFSGDMLVGYANDEGGNHMRPIGEFEGMLQNGEHFNALMFTNYVKYMQTQNGGDLGKAFSQIIVLCGDRIDKIEDFIKSTQSDNTEIYAVQQNLVSEGLFSPEEGFMGKALDGIKEMSFAFIADSITNFNNSIIAGGASVSNILDSIQSMTQYSIAGKSISSLLGEQLSSALSFKIVQLQNKCSSENIQTQQFSISKGIHEIGVNICPPGFRGNIFEQAHNECTKSLLTDMIQGNKNLAIGFSDDEGYQVCEENTFLSLANRNHGYITDPRHKTEVGTYLAGLSQQELQTLPSKLGKANLIPLLTQYKDGDFSGESYAGANWKDFFSPYMVGFDESMLGTIKNTINTSDAKGINDIILGGEDEDEIGEVLEKCKLCEQINKYDSESEIRLALSSQALKDTQGDFYAGLEEKLSILSKPQVVKASFENYYIESGVPESYITWELSEELENLINDLEGNTCSIDYIKKIREFNDTHLSDYDIGINEQQARTIITTLIQRNKDINELALIDIKYQLSSTTGASPEEIQEYFDMPEDERNEQIGELLGTISDTTLRETLRNSLIEQFDFREDIKAQESRSEDIIQGASAIYDAFWQPSAEHILRRPQDIGMIRDKSMLLDIFRGEYREQLRDKIELSDIYLEFLYDREIVLSFPGKIEINEVRLLPDSILSKSDIIIHLINQSIKYNEGKAIRDFLYAYSSADGPDLYQLVEGLHELMQIIAPEDAEKLRANIPRSILRAANSEILGVSLPNFEFQDESYYINLAQNLPHQRDINEQRGLGKINEIDQYLEYGNNSHEIIRLLCNKGLLGYTNFAKHQIGKDATFWKEIIDNGEISDIRYVNAQTRAYDGFQKHLLNSPRFTRWDSRTGIEDYITLNSIDDTMRWFDFLSNLDQSPDTKSIIESHPEILYSTQHALINKSFMNLESQEQQEAAVDFIILISSNSTDYLNANKIMEPLSEAGANIEKAALQNIEEYKIALGDIFESYQLSDEKIAIVLNILEENGDPRRSIEDIVKNSIELEEIFGSEEIVAEFLGEVSTHLKVFLDNDTELQIQKLDSSGVHEKNSELYNGLLQGGVFQRDTFLSTLSGYGKAEGIPMEDGESHTDYGLRVQAIFLEDLHLSNEQKELIILILKNEGDAESIDIFTANSVTIVKDSIATGGRTTLFETYRETRRAAGISYRTEGERSGEEIFNYNTGALEPNPDYTPQKENGDTKTTTKSSASTNSLEINTQTLYEIGGTPGAPNITIGQDVIQLDPEEAQAMKDPNVMKRWIDADNYFQEAGLTSIWRSYRKEVADAMNMSGGDIQINLNDNSLDQTEFLKFAQYSYQIANGKNSKPSSKITDLQNQFDVYGDIHAEDKSLLGDRFITDLNTLGINKELTSGQIAARFSELATGEGLSQEIENL